MNTPKYLEIAELLRIDIFVKHAKENTTENLLALKSRIEV